MRTKRTMYLTLALVALCATAGLARAAGDAKRDENRYSFYGETDKDALSYKVGEKMLFRITLLDDGKPVGVITRHDLLGFISKGA